MTYWLRFIRPWRKLKPNEVQAKIPMLNDPSSVGKAKKAWAPIPVRDPEIYPLLVCVGTAVVMFVAYNIHNLMENPDLAISKERRETPVMDRVDPEEAHQFTKHRARMATLRATPVTAEPRVTTLTDVNGKEDSHQDPARSRK